MSTSNSQSEEPPEEKEMSEDEEDIMDLMYRVSVVSTEPPPPDSKWSLPLSMKDKLVAQFGNDICDDILWDDGVIESSPKRRPNDDCHDDSDDCHDDSVDCHDDSDDVGSPLPSWLIDSFKHLKHVRIQGIHYNKRKAIEEEDLHPAEYDEPPTKDCTILTKGETSKPTTVYTTHRNRGAVKDVEVHEE